MDLQEFSAEMSRRGCVSEGALFCGTYLNRPFSVLFLNGKPGSKTSFRLRFRFDRGVKNALVKSIRSGMKGYMSLQRFNASDTTILEMNATVQGKVSFVEAFDRLMQLIVQEANTMGYANPPVCPACRQPGCDAYAYYGGSYTQVHAACVQQKNDQVVNKINENERSGSYALGFLGAFIGGIVGTVPSVLIIVFMDVISAWLCALIPLGAYYGYKLFKGRMNNAALGASVVMSILMIPGLDYFTTLLMVFQEEGWLLTPMEYIFLLSTYPEDFLPFLLQVTLFVGLGIVCVFGIVRKGNKQFYQDAAFSNATLRPIGQQEPVQY